ncbi:hypothetical protein M404DRAFT_25265 [Pisolithus tinctorius Marx 270]|uniref:Uncharacterized protein n=1 Tax=Pisolithus tinctorius Marx 270 TaxID=870435 RepID=A0A0C3NXI3_PISTI|nr:hypothetical protein M404DRAFT_25265 [Pisolithus tinctorius Marx 270]
MPQEHPQQVIAETQPGDGNYGAFNACILAKYNNHWVTSPNADHFSHPPPGDLLGSYILIDVST